MIKVPWHDALSKALESCFGEGVRISGEQRAGGGCINQCSVLSLKGGKGIGPCKVFIKRNAFNQEKIFQGEALGLQNLASVKGAPPVPSVYAGGTDRQGNFSFLLLEYLTPENKKRDFWEDFGISFARLHRNKRSEYSGFDENDPAASPEQSRTRQWTWLDFFREQRLGIQFQKAYEQGLIDHTLLKQGDRLLNRLETLLIPCDEGKASLLHGDLWAGNYLCGPGGRAWLIDPAVHYGYREADLAMTSLFGGFERTFYRAYNEEWPLEPGYDDRRDLYNLYHLLNHLNLFGSSYFSSVKAIVNRYI